MVEHQLVTVEHQRQEALHRQVVIIDPYVLSNKEFSEDTAHLLSLR